MAKRHMERWSASLIIWEMQIKTTIKYHIISVRTILFKKKDKCWQGCGEIETLVYCLWELKMMQPLWKAVINTLKN